MTDLDVACRPSGSAWTCSVRIGTDAAATDHEVGVSPADLARLSPGASDPVALVRASFGFLLEREPRESILHRFDLPVIGRYFPEYEARIRERLAE